MSEKKIVNIIATWKEEGWGPPGISWSEHVSSRWGGALAGARWGGALALAQWGGALAGAPLTASQPAPVPAQVPTAPTTPSQQSEGVPVATTVKMIQFVQL